MNCYSNNDKKKKSPGKKNRHNLRCYEKLLIYCNKNVRMHDSQSMKLNVKGDVNLDHYLLCSFSWIQSHELYQSSFCNLEYVSHVCVSQLISKNQSLHSLARDLLKLTLKAVWLCSKIDGVETIQINGLIKASFSRGK